MEAEDEAPVEAFADEGEFVEAQIAKGSMSACRVRMGKHSAHWICSDIIVPPSSFNDREQLPEGRSMLISVLHDGRGGLQASIDGEVLGLRQGDSLVVKAGSAYSLRNDSAAHPARMKMVVVFGAGA